ncbi:hypothetical protein [Candidatus Electrothrix sp.]|uniref:hypothetical protein n=1 Tax=Candidatus Electrothrix sp. TaxID=2170559 RepID=UPI004056CA24
MRKDAIIEELHKIRQQHARKFGYDLRKIFTDLKQQEEKSSRKFITLPVQRKPAGR